MTPENAMKIGSFEVIKKSILISKTVNNYFCQGVPFLTYTVPYIIFFAPFVIIYFIFLYTSVCYIHTCS